MEEIPRNYLWAALAISNLVALLTLLAAWKRPTVARVMYFLLFGWACWANSTTVLATPEVYLEYADFALLPFYKKFILGWFSRYGQAMVLAIACCQALMALSMLARGWLFKLGCMAGILFFIGIAPLGIGSGFPSSLIWAVGLYLLFKKNIDRTLWEVFILNRQRLRGGASQTSNKISHLRQ